jgi:hypothetical protein
VLVLGLGGVDFLRELSQIFVNEISAKAKSEGRLADAACRVPKIRF